MIVNPIVQYGVTGVNPALKRGQALGRIAGVHLTGIKPMEAIAGSSAGQIRPALETFQRWSARAVMESNNELRSVTTLRHAL